jgi:sugar lactone lactonase YvrE
MTSEVLVSGRHFTEDPRWRGDRLWYSDFYAHEVRSVGMAGDDRVEVMLDDQPSGLGWLPDGRLLIVSMTRRVVVRVEPDGSIVDHADVSGIATWHCNDMLVAPSGNAYVGHFGFDLDAFVDEHGMAGFLTEDGPPRAHVILVRPDGSFEVAADDMWFPNGTVMSPDGRTLIVAESTGTRLTAFDVADDGRLSNRRVWAELMDPFIPPDGIGLDDEGGVWVANPISKECARVVEGGDVTETVEFSQHPFACSLGGPDGMTLFACTAPTSKAAVCEVTTDARVEFAAVRRRSAGSP